MLICRENCRWESWVISLKYPYIFIFKGDESSQYLINKLIEENTLSQDGKLLIDKNDEGIDLEDRIMKLKTVLETLTLKS